MDKEADIFYEVAMDQLQKMLLMYFRNHPAKLHRSAADLTLQAMRKAFPCR